MAVPVELIANAILDNVYQANSIDEISQDPRHSAPVWDMNELPAPASPWSTVCPGFVAWGFYSHQERRKRETTSNNSSSSDQDEEYPCLDEKIN